MTCPHCGQNNFKWARRCDRCNRPLADAVAPVSVSASTTNEPARSAVAVEGRTFTFNGVSYTALARSRQLKDADVYPLQHQQSRLVIFELKVFPCEPGTPQYEEVKGRPSRSFRTQAELQGRGARIVVEEIYEQDGRLLGLQRAFREHPGPAYCETQMAAARTLMEKRQFAEAASAYDAILTLNPYHVPALGNKAVALMNSGDVAGSLACFERCVGIDVNMPEPQINMAGCLAGTGQSERATLALARLLKRSSWNFDHWLALVQMASTEDTLDVAERFIEPGLAALAGVPLGEQVRGALNESRTRWQRFLADLERACSQQVAQRWNDALQTLTRCSALSRRHAIAVLNQAICHYHLSDMRACRNTVAANHHRLLDHHHERTSMLLWMLSAVSLGDWQRAMAVVSAFQQHIAMGMAVVDMPRVPVAALPARPPGDGSLLATGSVLETMDVTPILTALSELARRPECHSNVAGIDVVVAMYKQLASL